MKFPIFFEENFVKNKMLNMKPNYSFHYYLTFFAYLSEAVWPPQLLHTHWQLQATALC